MMILQLFSATTLDHAPLEAVYIYFDTAIYDEIVKDEKVIFKDGDILTFFGTTN